MSRFFEIDFINTISILKPLLKKYYCLDHPIFYYYINEYVNTQYYSAVPIPQENEANNSKIIFNILINMFKPKKRDNIE